MNKKKRKALEAAGFRVGDAEDFLGLTRKVGAGTMAGEGGTPMPTTSSVVHSDPDILGGTPVFFGTRVPIRTLLDYLEAGEPLDEFLQDFPSVTREQAQAALQLAGQMLVAHANPA